MEDDDRSGQRFLRRTRFVLLLPLLLASCRVTSQSVAQSQQTQDYDRLEVIYRAHAASGPLFSPTVHSKTNSSSPEILPVSAQVSDELPVLAEPNWSMAELRIEYPHPEGRPGYARVTLRFKPVECGGQCEWRSLEERVEERMEIRRERRAIFRQRWFWERPQPEPEGAVMAEIDLPRAELDLVVAELNEHGFFVEGARANEAASDLEVRLNRRWTSKSWTYEPALDALTTRIYEEGRWRTVTEAEDRESSRWISLNWLARWR